MAVAITAPSPYALRTSPAARLGTLRWPLEAPIPLRTSERAITAPPRTRAMYPFLVVRPSLTPTEDEFGPPALNRNVVCAAPAGPASRLAHTRAADMAVTRFLVRCIGWRRLDGRARPKARKFVRHAVVAGAPSGRNPRPRGERGSPM